VSLAEEVVVLQGWRLATSLLRLCAEALAADPARSNPSVGPSFEATAGCGDAAASHDGNGVMDSLAAGAATATRRSLHSASGAADVAIVARRREHNMDKWLSTVSGIVLAVALLDRLTASVRQEEQRAGSSHFRPILVSSKLSTMTGTMWFHQLITLLA